MKARTKIPPVLYSDVRRMAVEEGKTLQAIADWLAEEKGIKVTSMTVHRALKRMKDNHRSIIEARRQEIDAAIVDDIRKSAVGDLEALGTIDKALAAHHADLAALAVPLPPRGEETSKDDRKFELQERRLRIQALRGAAMVGRTRQELRYKRLSLGTGVPDTPDAGGFVVRVLKPPVETDDE